MSKDKIAFYIDHDLREALELYIIDNDLDREKITLAKFADKIVNEWCMDPVLNDEYIFFAYRRGYAQRIRRLTVYLTNEEYVRAHRIYVRKYLRNIQSLNMMMANILEQWAIKNIDGYEEKFRKKFIVDEEESNEVI